ncbi:UNVERIFIED_CONTAM: hypothetical protein Sradi_6762900 [Sesamum radiatum]|uniref:Uncharacterized protein n=1 Tax=Sesamum radiatum TaxID=300843 RepID=A0AAW2JSM0_SESRA
MGFTMEFAENLMLELMEDPRELRELLYGLKDRSRCNKTEGNVELARPYGFWESQMTSSREAPTSPYIQRKHTTRQWTLSYSLSDSLSLELPVSAFLPAAASTCLYALPISSTGTNGT